MNTRLLFAALLFPFCCVLLRAQNVVRTIVTEHPTTDWAHYQFSGERNPCQVFIGVGTTPEAGGLKVDYTIDNTPARTYGVQVGDIILSLDNVAVSSYSELVRERNKHQQGEAFTLNILRNGARMNIDARFKSCSQEEQEQVQREEAQLRPILGIYEKEGATPGQGLVIGETIAGKGAALAGLQPGDVITDVEGQPVDNSGSLRAALTHRKPGDPVRVIYLRDGKRQQTSVNLSGDRQSFSYRVQRDPCAVFIGVYTTDAGAEGRGVRVTGVIDQTPAKESDVRTGDVILALDDQPINTYTELHQQRDKHRPGDAFRLTVLRDGSVMTIDATFKACPKDQPVQQPTELVIPETPPARSVQQPTAPDGPIALDLYPNPTFGPVNVRFEAEALPTTVRITDASGKVVYENVLNRFPGLFDEQIDLTGQTPGMYTLTMQQGKQLVSKSFVLLTRA